MTTAAAVRTATSRPFWSGAAGAGITVGGALLLLATVLEWHQAREGTAALVPAITVLLVVSTAAHAAAMLPLAFGRRGSDGAVAGSVLGKAALLVFGAAFLANQLSYLAAAYALPSQVDYAALGDFQLGAGVVQSAALLLGGVVIARRGVATGAARWALLVLATVSIVLGVSTRSADDLDALTALLLLSTVAQIVTGVVFLRHRRRSRR
ncbi:MULTISPECIES: hypothetical protein [unclassified Rathayibacter]|uniref:hypothetical protein n=1 Tax=unclassified Rathayibacter TaxID=2609250 RepID=UPI000F4CFE3D|nr:MULTISPECIES: hypothetical protein [unclassified Rathayibacter]ROP50198.1 hypothetical protein EDF45_1607 [Rathayibacter sp. PhB186]ROS53156.1 hypothetical protein EDF44_1607 [Rathayibacter sp. PhB185]